MTYGATFDFLAQRDARIMRCTCGAWRIRARCNVCTGGVVAEKPDGRAWAWVRVDDERPRESDPGPQIPQACPHPLHTDERPFPMCRTGGTYGSLSQPAEVVHAEPTDQPRERRSV